MNTPARIRRILKERGWSQRRLALFLRVRPATVSDWYNGKSEPNGPASLLLEMMEEDPAFGS